MNARDAVVLGDLAGRALASITGVIEDVHHAIRGRILGPVGDGGAPVGAAHDAIARPVYATVRAALRSAARLAGLGAALTRPAAAPALADSPRGALVTAALAGLCGDRLHDHGGGLVAGMAWRGPHGVIAPGAAELREAFPQATGRLVVFVHGLGETEAAWSLGAPASGGTYGSRLEADLGFTALYARCNTGRHISDNAALLAELLEATVAAWPVPVQKVVLVGHSMGGLICDAAALVGAERGHAWLAHLRHLVSLASPHHGAPLEKVVNALSVALARVPEARPLARVLNARSAGIKDLRYGARHEREWGGHDADELLTDRREATASLPGVQCWSVAATLGRDADGLAARLLGDLLVRRASAAGGGRRPAGGTTHHIPGASHLAVLNHPEVDARLREWLGDRRAIVRT